MSASERLRALVDNWQCDPDNAETILSAMHEIIDVVEAAEHYIAHFKLQVGTNSLREALETLDAKLGTEDFPASGVGADDCPVMGRDYPEFSGGGT